MKIKTHIFLFALILPFTSFGQDDSTRLKIICATPTGEIYYVVNGNIFHPMTSAENKIESSIKFCDGYKHVYYLEGLKLPENRFLEIGIKRKDVIEKKSEYAYQYRNNDTTSCIEFINLFVSIYMPIKLNGVELKADEREKKLRNLSSEEIISITRKKSLFGKSIIEITTI